MVLGKEGNEIRLIEKSPTATPAHRTKDGLRIGSSKPLVNTSDQTTYPFPPSDGLQANPFQLFHHVPHRARLFTN
jgi:hypothetical protein